MAQLNLILNFITIFDNPAYDLLYTIVCLGFCRWIAYKIGGALGFEGWLGGLLWLVTTIVVFIILGNFIKYIGISWLTNAL